MSKLVQDLAKAMRTASGSKTKPADDTAVVRRIEGGTAWVHIPGGVDETPVEMTIDCKPGEMVKVRRAGGKAWLVGNGSAPPTDDTKANTAIRQIEEFKTAAGYALERIYKGVQGINTLIRQSVNGIEVGRVDDEGNRVGGLSLLGPDGMEIFGGDDGSIELAHIGYGDKTDSQGQTVKTPFFTFGKNLILSRMYGFACGRNNKDGNYLFAVGDGSSETRRRNAFAVSPYGIEIDDHKLVMGSVDMDSTMGSEFTGSTSDEYAPPSIVLQRFGNIVSISGVVYPKATITGGVAQHTICTIPSGIGCRPYMREVVSIQQGSGTTLWCCRVKPDGTVTFSRAQSGGSYVNVTNTTWLPFHVVWDSNLIAD